MKAMVAEAGVTVVARAFFSPGPVQRMMGMPVQTLDYFDHPVTHDASQATEELTRLGVRCPRLPEYAERLIAFYLGNVDTITRGAMV